MQNIELPRSGRKFGTIKITRAVRLNEVTNTLRRKLESSPAIFQIANHPSLLPVKSSFPLRNFALESQTANFYISRAIARVEYFSNTFFPSSVQISSASENCTRDPTSNFPFFFFTFLKMRHQIKYILALSFFLGMILKMDDFDKQSDNEVIVKIPVFRDIKRN